ncbi:MAG: FAD-binding oxidoreductase [Pseudonocardiaceae bacterium]
MTAFEGTPVHGPAVPAPAGLAAVMRDVVDVVGPDQVAGWPPGCALPGTPNVGMYRPRHMQARIRPHTVEQVARVIGIVNRHGAPCAVHAVSTGHNWGLGSREPALDDPLTLELDDIDRVRQFDLDAGWAVVEPGVTQGVLADLLAGTGRMLNVTASSAHTSVLGNAVDRGVGLRRQRVDDVAGLEVVLPDGATARLGWWPGEEGEQRAMYPHGLGPSLMPLFFQSNFGVVTAAVIRLLPRPEAQRVTRMSFARDHLEGAVDALRRWTAQGLVHGVLKIYDEVSTEFYGGRPHEFMAHMCVSGTLEYVDAVSAVLAGDARRVGLFTGLDDPGSAPEPGDVIVTMAERAFAGDPSSNDTMLAATLGRPAGEIDEHGTGWLFFLPMIPFTGRAVARAHALLAEIHDRTGVRAGCTVNALNSDLIDFVVSFKFDRDRDTERAHRALDLAYELFAAEGFLPYRLDIDHASWVDRAGADGPALRLRRELKKTLDPQGTIAPGRYA